MLTLFLKRNTLAKMTPDVQPGLSGGWKPVEGEPGMYTGESFQPHLTPEFQKHAEASRARWDLFKYLEVKIKQIFGQPKRSHPKGG